MTIEITNQTGTHTILDLEWGQVAAKKAVKSFFKDLPEELKVTKISVARTGTVYVTLEGGEWDADYKCFGEGEICDVRISDHECVAGSWSFDGRTQGYTDPDVEVTNTSDLEDVYSEIKGVLDVA